MFGKKIENREIEKMQRSFVDEGCEVVRVSHWHLGSTMHVLYPDDHIEDYYFDKDGNPSHYVKTLFDDKGGQKEINGYRDKVRKQKQDKLEKFDTKIHESLKRMSDSGQIVIVNGEIKVNGSIQPPSGDGGELGGFVELEIGRPADLSAYIDCRGVNLTSLPHHAKRMFGEYEALKDKIHSLTDYLNSFDEIGADDDLRRAQLDVMKSYLHILGSRLNRDIRQNSKGGTS